MNKSPKKGLFVGNSHANGGIPSEVKETGQQIEIEGDEYYICREAYNSSKNYSFQDKSNKQILDKIYSDTSCKLNQSLMAAGDFIICKVVVRDSSKHSRSGTIKEIVNEMQGEKSCKVENGSSSKKLGGAVHTEKQKEKVAIVMKEFKDKELKTSHGKKVTNPKQAVAIALSEADRIKKVKGGSVKNEWFSGELSFLNW